MMFPPSVNYHINTACNYSCHHCFAVFDDVKCETGKGMLPNLQQIAVVQQLDQAGFEKLTIAGGESTLVPWLSQLFEAFSGTTMLVTNGSMLTDAKLDELAPHLNWVVLSIDAADVEVSRKIGRQNNRGQAMDANDYIELANRIQARGLRLKVNTVVNQANLSEDMCALISAMSPERWKVLQVLAVEGQNDGAIEHLKVTHAQFNQFIKRHVQRLPTNTVLVPEPCDTIRGSYAMVDPAGRFFDSTLGCHTYSQPILEVGVNQAFQQINFQSEIFEQRGGRYDWA